MMRPQVWSAATRCRLQNTLLHQQRCSFATKIMAWSSSDPLHVLQQECQARGLCNGLGQRLPEADWRIAIAMASDGRVPNIRTVTIERISSDGIDFCLKRGTAAAAALQHQQPVSFLHSQGKFLAGQSAEQWRGEGACVPLELDQVLDQIPPFTVTSMVGSTRMVKERRQETGNDNDNIDNPTTVVSTDRAAVGSSKSHMREVMQTVRQELEQGQVSRQELEDCIHPFRLQPERVECMIASPDNHVMWDRWEWLHQNYDNNSTGSSSWQATDWNDAVLLVPH